MPPPQPPGASGPFGESARHIVEAIYLGIGAEPHPRSFPPHGISPFFALWFLPQPVGAADPGSYGLHHEWALGVTYRRLALQYTDPQTLEREVREQQARPHLPAQAPQIRGPGDIGLFDVPFVLFGGGSDYLNRGTAPMQFGGPAFTADDAAYQKRAAEYEAMEQAEIDRRKAEVKATGKYTVLVRLPWDGPAAPATPGTVSAAPSGGFFPDLVSAISANGQAAEAVAGMIAKQLVTERADP